MIVTAPQIEIALHNPHRKLNEQGSMATVSSSMNQNSDKELGSVSSNALAYNIDNALIDIL